MLVLVTLVLLKMNKMIRLREGGGEGEAVGGS